MLADVTSQPVGLIKPGLTGIYSICNWQHLIQTHFLQNASSHASRAGAELKYQAPDIQGLTCTTLAIVQLGS
jgi:hypothetical protein